MVQAPVGIRCKECGKPERMPTYDVGTIHYTRALGVALAVAALGGVLWVLVNLSLGGLPFVSGLFGLGLGYGVGELLGLVVNRKRSFVLAFFAGGAVTVAFLISSLFGPWHYGLWDLGLVVIGVALAVQRVRP